MYDGHGAGPALAQMPPARGGLVFRVLDAILDGHQQATAWLHPADMKLMGIEPGDVLTVSGRTEAVAIAGFVATDAGERAVMLDPITRRSAGVQVGEGVRIAKTGCGTAITVRLSRILAEGQRVEPREGRELAAALSGVPVCKGVVVRDPLAGPQPAYRVAATVPDGPVRIGARTAITFVDHEVVRQRPSGLTYADIGGLDRELERVREAVELPLRFPALLQHLGIRPPKGILLHGPPGTGKTLVARVLAAESQSYFIHVNGPEIVQKYYGESEARLRELFDLAEHHAPSILFIDEVDAIAPRRADVTGEVEKRLVAQFLALLDGFNTRGQVIVLGATNLLEHIDPALRRPGRFDREIEIGVPNRAGRRRILDIHTHSLPTAPDVSLDDLAQRSPGFVGADLAALCQDAAMEALRRVLHDRTLLAGEEPAADELTITAADFGIALRQVEPSATRELIVERPPLRLRDVGGQHEAKALLAPWLVAGTEWPGQGLLLAGPPGSGKTHLIRALAGELGLPLLEVEAGAIYSRWQGESERTLAEAFARARRTAPCLLFFDSIDALAPARTGGEGGSQYRLLAQLLREIDRLTAHPEVLLAGATNRLDLLDGALIRSGRFDYLIELAPLAPAERREVLQVHTRPLHLAPEVDLDELVSWSEGLAPADLGAACRRAQALAAGGKVGRAHLREGLDALRRLTERRAQR